MPDIKNNTLSLYQAVLLGLCVNYNEDVKPFNGWKCEMKFDEYNDLRNLSGRTLKLATLQKLPLSGAVEDENGKLRGIGIAFDLFHEVQKKAGFQYDLTLPEHNNVGNENEGIIQLLNEKKVDMAVTFIPLMTALRDMVDYSSTLTEFEWVLFMARPAASASHSGLLAPFQGEVWVCILISLIVGGPTMYLIALYRDRLERNKEKPPKPPPKFNPYSLNGCCWFVYGALMKQSSTLNPLYDSSRLFFATWWIFITILTSFYTANLTAFLTLSHFTLTIQTTEDIYKHHRHWMSDHDGYAESMIFIENSFDYLKQTIPKYGRFTDESLSVRLQKILKGEIYIAEKRRAKGILALDYANKTKNHVPEKKRCTFVLAPQKALIKPMAFAFPKGSKLRDLFDPLFQRFVSAGIITHLLEANSPIPEICPLDLADRERKLLNSDLATTYRLIFVGFATALFAFIGEVIFRYINKKETTSKKGPYIKSEDSYIARVKNISDYIRDADPKAKASMDENFRIYEYYKEIMPYGYNDKKNFWNKNGRDFLRDKNLNSNQSENSSKNLVYQFLN